MGSTQGEDRDDCRLRSFRSFRGDGACGRLTRSLRSVEYNCAGLVETTVVEPLADGAPCQLKSDV
jgi:hypothetical protein